MISRLYKTSEQAYRYIQTVNETLHSLHCNHFYFLISAWLVLTIFTCVGLFKSGELAKSFEQWLVYTVNTFKNRSTFQTISIAFVNLLLLLIKWQKKQNLQF